MVRDDNDIATAWLVIFGFIDLGSPIKKNALRNKLIINMRTYHIYCVQILVCLSENNVRKVYVPNVAFGKFSWYFPF